MIKLLNIGRTKEGVIRLQSQLYLGSDLADFILENGVLKTWGNGIIGFDFYKIDIPYQVVSNKHEMQKQAL